MIYDEYDDVRSMVPPLALCQLIPEGSFRRVHYYWYCDEDHGISFVRHSYLDRESKIYPAPLFDEILPKLPREQFGESIFLQSATTKKDWFIGYGDRRVMGKTPADAALKLWFAVNRRDWGKA